MIDGKRIIVFGGSFDPPHIGHEMIVSWALSTGKADHVIVVPCFVHAFPEKKLSSYTDRFSMCGAMTYPIYNAYTLNIDKNLPKPSLMANTLNAVKQKYDPAELKLIIGLDVMDQTSKWEKFDEVRRLARILVIGGPSFPWSCSVRSTEVRERLKAGKDVSDLVPARVLKYINDAKLYQEKT